MQLQPHEFQRNAMHNPYLISLSFDWKYVKRNTDQGTLTWKPTIALVKGSSAMCYKNKTYK
jgi:hypothetical protein